LSAKLGFDLFTRMQNKYLRRLQEMDLQPVLHTKVLLPVDGLSGTFRLPESYVTSYNDRLDEESRARLAPNTASLVALAGTWKDKYGPFPDEVQKQFDVLCLHSCIKQLGIDLVGFVVREGNNNVVDGMADCIFRAPGLRPRHWATLLAELPNKMPPDGVDVVFPARFSPSQADLHVVGGIPFDLKLLRPDFADDDAEEEYWDTQDAIEADFMASSAEIGDSMAEALDSMDQYPRLIVSNFDPMAGSGIADSTSMVQQLLGLLMPIANIVHDKQAAQASKARAAIAMREKQESFQETDEASDEEEE
jgi:TRCF domain